jgi:lipopolysaccharide/colanic/teichoic acid biosynthesis glycosyltransferase
MNGSHRHKILLAVTSPLSWVFYKGLIGHMRISGFQPILLSSVGVNLQATSEEEAVTSVPVRMDREINVLKDLASLWMLYQTIRRIRPATVDASTPKAGLLVGVAGWLARVPCRVYSLRGLRLETATGIRCFILWLAEWVACSCSHRVICSSPSLRERVISLRLVSREKAIVLEKGSAGIDLDRFFPRDPHSPETKTLSHQLRIPAGAPVVGFVGRLVKDKGIRQLVEAFETLRKTFPELRLLLLGDFEDGDLVELETHHFIESTPAVIRTGFVLDAAPYYALMNVLALPTYREGFPQVPLEAQASGVPVVTTTATGAIDSVIDGVTGFLVPVGDSGALAAAIGKLLADDELRSRMGRAGRGWMERDFRTEARWKAQAHLYHELLAENLPETSGNNRKRIIKRAFDFSFSVIALVFLSPLFFTVALLVRLFLGKPVLFRQDRPGLNAKSFTLLKFRTMTYAHDAKGELLTDAQRLTALGRFLRSTSLDELPELINVIRGEMSLVGPRPLLPKYLSRYTAEQMRRHEIKPGVTGWAQIHGRNAVDWNKKFTLDLWYVDHQSFWLDLSILAKTVWLVLKREGIAQSGHVSMPEFIGVTIKHKEETAL